MLLPPPPHPMPSSTPRVLAFFCFQTHCSRLSTWNLMLSIVAPLRPFTMFMIDLYFIFSTPLPWLSLPYYFHTGNRGLVFPGAAQPSADLRHVCNELPHLRRSSAYFVVETSVYRIYPTWVCLFGGMRVFGGLVGRHAASRRGAAK